MTALPIYIQHLTQRNFKPFLTVNSSPSKNFRYPLFLKSFCHQLLRLGFRYETLGCQNLWGQNPVILAGNHTGYLDSLLIIAATDQPIRFMVHHKVLDWPVVGKLVKRAHMIILEPGQERAALRESIQHLQTGQSICIFPEGKLSEQGELNPFHPGVGFLQKKANVPIIPFAIQGGFEAWAFGQRIPRFRKVRIRFGKPIYPKAHQCREAVTQEVREAVKQLQRLE